MIECRLPISPTASFLNRVVLFAASIRRFHPDTAVRAYIGQSGGPTKEAVQIVERAFLGHKVGWEWIGAREFDAWEGTRAPYLATMNRRFRAPIDGDHIIIADADVLVTGPLDYLFIQDTVQGVMAHVAPISDQDWEHLFHLFGLHRPTFVYELSGAGVMGPEGKLTPWYANSGFVFAPRHLFERLIRPYNEAINLLRGAMADVYWADQLALAMAVAKSGVPAENLSLAWNFPNQHGFDVARSRELAHAKVIHYLRTTIIDRDRDFESQAAMAAFVARTDLVGSNEVLRRNVAELMGDMW